MYSPLVFKIHSKKTFLVFLVRNLKTQGKVIKSWCLFGQKPKNTRKSHRKLMSFRRLFGMNFEDEGARWYFSYKQFQNINFSCAFFFEKLISWNILFYCSVLSNKLQILRKVQSQWLIKIFYIPQTKITKWAIKWIILKF